jgi:hypothetical protein
LHTYYDESDRKMLEIDGITSVPYTVVGDGIGGAEVLGSTSHIGFSICIQFQSPCYLRGLSIKFVNLILEGLFIMNLDQLDK